MLFQRKVDAKKAHCSVPKLSVESTHVSVYMRLHPLKKEIKPLPGSQLKNVKVLVSKLSEEPDVSVKLIACITRLTRLRTSVYRRMHLIFKTSFWKLCSCFSPCAVCYQIVQETQDCYFFFRLLDNVAKRF